LNVISRVGGRAQLEVAIRTKAYLSAAGSTREALSGVAFALEEGKVGAIVGPSGCGKTTLLRIIAGLDARFEGSVALPKPVRLAVVFQEPRLLPWRSVEDNVRLVVPDIAEAELGALFAALGLFGHRQHFPNELSLGLARRVALARALAVHPDLLLLDEPFASLDAATAAALMEQITDIVEARGMTTLLATHDIDAAIRLADVVYVLSDGPARLLAAIEIADPRRRLTREAAAGIAAQIAAAR
jgi:NitT/TauT family transport system ATP-binding protein